MQVCSIPGVHLRPSLPTRRWTCLPFLAGDRHRRQPTVGVLSDSVCQWSALAGGTSHLSNLLRSEGVEDCD